MSTSATPTNEHDASENGGSPKRLGFNLSEKVKELEAEDAGATFQICDAEGEPAFDIDGSPVTWTVCGINSEAYRRAEAWQNKVFRQQRGVEETPQQERERQAEFVARCSKGFSGIRDGEGLLQFTTKNATRVLLALPYIARQVSVRMGNHAGFTKPASTS